MNKKMLVIFGLLLAAAVVGCGQSAEKSTQPSSHNPALAGTEVFNVSGAQAIVAASSTTVNGSAIKKFTSSDVTELLKLNAAGSIEAVFSSSFGKSYHPPISVIELGPDGSLYVGFSWGIWVKTGSGSSEDGEQVAFFQIKTDGTVEIVDRDISGVGSWYSYSENGELPKKQVQFDSDGNIYYLGMTNSGKTVLKKKTVNGTTSQIGSSNMQVRDFLVTPGGLVFFHGSNSGNWNLEWLRVFKNSTVNNIFYNDGSSGWLRAYYYHLVGSQNYIFLVGENLTLLDQNERPKKYSGIIRVALSESGAPLTVEAIYDDNNMYSDTYNNIGDQLTWGYWDPAEMTNRRFFATNNYNELILPLSLEAGVTEAEIKTFIRQKYQTITIDSLEAVTFAGQTTDESWMMRNILSDLVNNNISGTTWAKWRQENGLSSVRFGNAKQLLFADTGKLYAVISLDNWGSGTSKGDKLFQITDASGEASITAFPQDNTNYFRSMSKVRLYGSYAIYLSSKVGKYKIMRLDLADPTANPVDMIPDKSNVEIFSFNYDSANSQILYDVYDLNANASYLARQAITSNTAAAEVSAEGYTITDVVPFRATN